MISLTAVRATCDVATSSAAPPKPPERTFNTTTLLISFLATLATILTARLTSGPFTLSGAGLLRLHPVLISLALAVPRSSALLSTLSFALINLAVFVAYASGQASWRSLHAVFGMFSIIAFKILLTSQFIDLFPTFSSSFSSGSSASKTLVFIITHLLLVITVVLGACHFQILLTKYPKNNLGVSVAFASVIALLCAPLAYGVFARARSYFHGVYGQGEGAAKWKWNESKNRCYNEEFEDDLERLQSDQFATRVPIDEIVDVRTDTREISSGSSGHNGEK